MLKVAVVGVGGISGAHIPAWEEMKDAELKKLVEIIGYTEGLPVVVNPGVLDPKQFIDTVLNRQNFFRSVCAS